jgi:hypothetical protein
MIRLKDRVIFFDGHLFFNGSANAFVSIGVNGWAGGEAKSEELEGDGER